MLNVLADKYCDLQRVNTKKASQRHFLCMFEAPPVVS